MLAPRRIVNDAQRRVWEVEVVDHEVARGSGIFVSAGEASAREGMIYDWNTTFSSDRGNRA